MNQWQPKQIEWMARALRLAKKGQFTARPNPMVGCVLVKDGEIVGEGFHQQFGQPHAEVNALNMAAEKAKGATAFVTLEPCSHTGKTGPCADALINAGVAEVVVAMTDPNPQVSGTGIKRLQAVGISVLSGLLENEARQLNRGFICRMEQGRPFVSLKLATSVDGRTAMADGKSQWITGPAARRDVQKLRAMQDAIITGSGTVIFDNPSLTVRQEDAGDWWQQAAKMGFRQPARIVLDRQQRLDSSFKIFNDNASVYWFIAGMQGNGESEKAITKDQPLESDDNAPHIHRQLWRSESELLDFCGTQQMNNVLIEAGHKLAGSFLTAGLVDELIIYMAPKLMGSSAMPAAKLVIDQMNQSLALHLVDIRHVGADLRFCWRPYKD